MFDSAEEDREFLKQMKAQKQFYAETNYDKRLEGLKKKIPDAAFVEAANNLVRITYHGNMFYWYPHKNIIRRAGEEKWKSMAIYNEAVKVVTGVKFIGPKKTKKHDRTN